MIEEWKEIPGWAGLYEVSNTGEVRSMHRHYRTAFGLRGSGGKNLKAFPATTGYAAVNFTRPGGGRMQFLVHSLVLLTFVGKRPDGMEACHKDGNRMNPELSNLRWDTRKNNHQDKYGHGTALIGEKHGNAKLRDAEAHLIKSGAISTSDAVGTFGVCKSTVNKIRRGNSWTHIHV